MPHPSPSSPCPRWHPLAPFFALPITHAELIASLAWPTMPAVALLRNSVTQDAGPFLGPLLGSTHCHSPLVLLTGCCCTLSLGCGTAVDCPSGGVSLVAISARLANSTCVRRTHSLAESNYMLRAKSPSGTERTAALAQSRGCCCTWPHVARQVRVHAVAGAYPTSPRPRLPRWMAPPAAVAARRAGLAGPAGAASDSFHAGAVVGG